MTRLKTTPEVDAQFEPFDLLGIVFYATAYPNTIFDISETHERKHQAIDKYRAQFSAEEMAMMLTYLSYKEQEYAQEQPFSHSEPLKVLQGMHLHGFPDAMNT